MSTLKTTNLQHASAASPAIVLASDGTATAQLSSLNGGALSGARNRIINGDMRIDQRNAGASITGNDYTFPVDRWFISTSQSSKLTAQQNAGSVTPPAGHTHYLGLTSSSAYSVTAGDYFLLTQIIEGLNAADLDWGLSSAVSITLSFWIRSSLTGTFGGSIRNSADNRSYPFSYTITSANTWEKKTISISGDTAGTWLKTNGVGIKVTFGLGVGSTNSNTAGAWIGSTAFSATGATSVVGTNGATFYITGVQLEAGSVATPFERRSYGQELALCQRYCLVDTNESTPYRWFASGFTKSTTLADFGRQFPVTMRTAPSITVSGTWLVDGPTFGVTPTSVTDTGYASRSTGRITATASSGYASNNPVWLASDGTTNLRSITYSAEL